eukprot:COSAG04_NODE_11436_length_709_cov_0.829508_2_plen_67_part_01
MGQFAAFAIGVWDVRPCSRRHLLGVREPYVAHGRDALHGRRVSEIANGEAVLAQLLERVDSSRKAIP